MRRGHEAVSADDYHGAPVFVAPFPYIGRDGGREEGRVKREKKKK